MTKIKLFVGLKIPDTTAITAFNTLRKMGINVEKLEREDYYEFEWLNNAEDFIRRIQEVDILVNANKNYSKAFEYDKMQKDDDSVWVVVKDKEKDTNLLNTLRERLGFHDIAEMHKGVLWKIKASRIAADMAVRELLFNPHYQEYEIL